MKTRWGKWSLAFFDQITHSNGEQIFGHVRTWPTNFVFKKWKITLYFLWRPLAETFGRDVHQRLGAIRGRLVHFPLNYLRLTHTISNAEKLQKISPNEHIYHLNYLKSTHLSSQLLKNYKNVYFCTWIHLLFKLLKRPWYNYIYTLHYYFCAIKFSRDEDLQPAKLAKESMVPAELWK